MTDVISINMRLLALPSFLLLLAATSNAAVTVTYTNELGTGVVGSQFTPSYAVSSTDLINGKAPTASSGTFNLELSGGSAVVTDGSFGSIQTGSQPADGHGIFATVGNTAGTSLSYNLGANAAGYAISNITVLGGWNDNGRDQLSFTVFYSLVGSATFTALPTANFNPSVTGGLQSANRAVITDGSLPFFLTGVDDIRIDFNATENGYSGLTEIDVYGAAVPEPGVSLLGALGSLTLLMRRRRTHA